ncbi:hypothetical protein DRW42_08310 [Pedobacter miscanthi]|uniref:Carboxypeptidase regulatory-like domain-containing protein n=1 Tax=Pedobacter miscanthi TaxID=2259170 RepID=A0A366L486_9SPHI|nr:hypothetical protein DRW42_08310 [Pedobacter miscanthi]
MVVDFTRFSDTELKNWFNQNHENTCGRFKPEQLGRYIGRKPLSFFNFFKPGLVAASVLAFLSTPKFAYSKNADALASVSTQYQQVYGYEDDGYTFIKGRVYNQDGIGLNDINIEVNDQNIFAKTAADGSFFIKIKKPQNRTIAELTFTSGAYEVKKRLFILGEEKEIYVVLSHAMQIDFTNKIVVDKLSERLVGTLGGISIKTSVTRRIVSGVVNIFR